MDNKTLKGLTIEIGGDTTKLGKALADVEKQGRDLSSELGQINKLLKLDPKNTELLAQKQKVLSEAIANTEKKLGTLREAEKQVQAQFERGEVSEAQYRALQREIVEAENKLKGYEKAAKETADAQQHLADEAGNVGEKMDDAGEASDEAGGKFNVAGAAAAALTAAFVALGKAGVDAFNEIDGGADNVIRATGAIGATADDLEESYKEVASQVVGSFEDIGATVGEVNTRFGYTGKQLEEVSTDFMKFAEVTGVNSADAVKAVTRALNDSGIPLDEYKILLDQLAKAGQAAGIDVTKLAEGLSVNGATMRSMGLDTAESIALLAQFELSGADATTMLSGMKKAMATWASEGKNGSQEFEKLCEGIKSGSVSAADALDVFGTRAGPQLVDAIQSGKFEYQDMLETLRKSQGTLEATFGELADGGYSVDRSLQRVKVIMSDVGEEIMESAAPALEEFVDYLEDSGAAKKLGDTIRTKVVPALKTIGSWVGQNGPAIKGMAAGAAAAFVAYKVAVVASTVSHKGLKGAIMATTVAQKALNLVQKATPWGLVAAGVATVAAGLVAYKIATDDAAKSASNLTEEEQALIKEAEEAAEAFREQRKATDEALGKTTTEMKNVQDLADELRSLADASGRVQEKDQARADLILGRLNEALGTEYSQVEGLIQGFGELCNSIDQVILSKTANALLEKANPEYLAALEQETTAWNEKKIKLKDYEAQQEVVKQAEEEYLTWKELYNDALQKGDFQTAATAQTMIADKEKAWDREKATLEDKWNKYVTANLAYEELQAVIGNYEKAQEEALKGNYQTAVDLFARKGDLYTEHAETVDKKTAEVLATLEKEAYDAYVHAKNTKANFENGVSGYTEEMVKEAEQSHQKLLDEYNTAYDDAFAIYQDFGRGAVAGLGSMTDAIIAAGVTQVRLLLDAEKNEADSHSPSRKTMALGEDMGEGTVIGIERKTKDVQRAAKEQIAAVIDAYQAPASTGQQTFRSIADQQAARYTSTQETSNANGPMLEKILSAIERGQVLTLDGDAIVGGTADRMDNALGRRRALAARGATK